jgi:uncharacterized protein YdaU (DUF1376 family)
MTGKAPAFQFYPQDYLSSSRVAEMTLEEEGVYIRLLCYCWSCGSIPADPERCAKLAGKGCTVEIATSVQRSFNEHPTDSQRLVHNRLEIERERQQNRRDQASEAGRKSAERRATHAKTTAKMTVSNGRSTDVQRKVNPSSSSSSSSSSSNTKHTTSLPVAFVETGESETAVQRTAFAPPSIQEVIDFVLEKHLCVDAVEFCSFYGSKNWMVGKTKMKDWRLAAVGWDSRKRKEMASDRQTHLSANQRREQTTANSFNKLLRQASGVPVSPGSD